MPFRKFFVVVFVVFSLFSFLAPLHAGVVLDIDSDQFLFPDWVWTLNPNNNNSSSFGLANMFLIGAEISSSEAVDIVFSGKKSHGTTEYTGLLGLKNDTGTPWTSVDLSLGFGTGENFVLSGDDKLDFDTPHQDPSVLNFTWFLSPVFLQTDHGSDLIHFEDGILNSDDWDILGLLIKLDVPDFDTKKFQFTLRVNANGDVAEQEVPNTPEPATLFLFGSGLAGLFFTRRKRT